MLRIPINGNQYNEVFRTTIDNIQYEFYVTYNDRTKLGYMSINLPDDEGEWQPLVTNLPMVAGINIVANLGLPLTDIRCINTEYPQQQPTFENYGTTSMVVIP